MLLDLYVQMPRPVRESDSRVAYITLTMPPMPDHQITTEADGVQMMWLRRTPEEALLILNGCFLAQVLPHLLKVNMATSSSEPDGGGDPLDGIRERFKMN